MINKILIVDDRYENRYLLQALLEGNGYQIISAENGLDALEKLKTNTVDAIISDILMPGMDGFKLCRSVKENPESAHIPFIFYTASYTEPKDRDFGLSLGADEYIIKPIEPDIFITIVKEVFSPFNTGQKISKISSPRNRTSFYTSYAEIIENKLNKKLTELENQREALQLSEKKYEHFFKIIPEIGYLAKVGEGLPMSFEGRIEEITGYPAEKFRVGTMRWEEIIHPDDRDSYLLEKEKAGLLSGNIFAMQYRIVNKNGKIRWIHEIASVIPGTPQGVTMIQGAICDNTLQIESEKQILESEKHYRFLFESMAEGVVFMDKTGHIIDANPSAERILGLSRDQLLGRESKDPGWKAIKEDFSDFPGEEHPSMVTLRTGQKCTGFMGVYNPRDEQYHWIFINSVPVFQQGERTPCQVFTTFEDITGEHESKNALLESEKKYRELVESISDTLFILDKEGIFTYISPVVIHSTGLDPSNFIGHHYLDYIHTDDQEKMKKWFISVLNNQIAPVEFRSYTRDRKILYLTAKASPIYEGNEAIGVTGIIADISAWKIAEKIKNTHTKEIQGLLSLHLLSRENENQIFSFALDTALDITESRIGFIAFISKGKSDLIVQVWSPEVMNPGQVNDSPDLPGISSSYLWTECLKTRKPVIINDFSLRAEHPSYPEGHLPITRFIAIPVIDGEVVKAIIALANRDEPYTKAHASTLIILGNTLWDIISRKRADREINTALSQIAQNMEQMAILNDTIRNPLSVIASISDLINPEYAKVQTEAIGNIDSVITRLDKGWIQSEKVRNFLVKHYKFTESELDTSNRSE